MTDEMFTSALGPALADAVRRRNGVLTRHEGSYQLLEAGPTDAALVFPYDGSFWLGVHQLEVGDLSRSKLKKARGLWVASENADVVAALVKGVGAAVRHVTLWEGAHSEAANLLDRCSKKLRSLTLRGPHLDALPRVRHAEDLTLVGADEAQVLRALDVPGLKRLVLRNSALPVAGILATATAHQRVEAEGFWLNKHLVRVPASAMPALAGTTVPKECTTLEVVGPGTVSTEALAPLVAQVEVLQLDSLTLDGDLAPLGHQKLVALRLRNVQLTGALNGLEKLKKLAIVDLTDTEPDVPVGKGTRIHRRRPGAAVMPLPKPAAFQALATAPASRRAEVLLAWADQLAEHYHTLLAFEPSQQGPIKKLVTARTRSHWLERLFEAIASMYNICMETRTVVRRAAYRKSVQGLTREPYYILSRLNASWRQDEANPEFLAQIARFVAEAAWAAQTWHDEEEGSSGLDAAGVREALGPIGADEAPLPFPELDGMGFEPACLLATKWCGRALTSVLLELPARPAKRLRELRNLALQGHIGALMEEAPKALKGSDRAVVLAQAIRDAGTDLQAREPTAVRRLAYQLRALYDGEGEAEAQALDLHSDRHRIQWVDVHQEPRFVAWARALAPRAPHAPDLSDPAKLPPAPVLGRTNDAWGQQLATWIDTLSSCEQGSSVPLLVGRHMAEWQRENPFAELPPNGAWEDRLGTSSMGIDERDVSWDVLDPLCDRWALRLLDLLLERHDDDALRDARVQWMAGSTNRMLARWPSLNTINEPGTDFWIRAYRALDALCVAHPDDAALRTARQAFQEVVHGALAGDDDQTWLSALPAALHQLGGVSWEELQAETDRAVAEG